MSRAAVTSAAALGALLLVPAASCTVALDGLEGRACDGEHLCPPPYECRLRRCVSPLPTGTGAAHDDGGIVWRQVEDGFDEKSAGPGCTARVDTFDGNRLIAQTAGPPPGDRAWARVRRDRLPQREEGRLRGKFRWSGQPLPAGVEFTIAALSTHLGETVVELYLIPSGPGIGIRSGAGVLGANMTWSGFGVNTHPDVAPIYVRDSDTVLEVRWVKGQFIKVLVNDSLIHTATLSPSSLSALSGVPAVLELGVPGCSGCAPDAGFHFEYQDWRLSGDSTADFDP